MAEAVAIHGVWVPEMDHEHVHYQASSIEEPEQFDLLFGWTKAAGNLLDDVFGSKPEESQHIHRSLAPPPSGGGHEDTPSAQAFGPAHHAAHSRTGHPVARAHQPVSHQHNGHRDYSSDIAGFFAETDDGTYWDHRTTEPYDRRMAHQHGVKSSRDREIEHEERHARPVRFPPHDTIDREREGPGDHRPRRNERDPLQETEEGRSLASLAQTFEGLAHAFAPPVQREEHSKAQLGTSRTNRSSRSPSPDGGIRGVAVRGTRRNQGSRTPTPDHSRTPTPDHHVASRSPSPQQLHGVVTQGGNTRDHTVHHHKKHEHDKESHHHGHHHHSSHEHDTGVHPQKWPQGARVTVTEDRFAKHYVVEEQAEKWVSDKGWDGTDYDFMRSKGVGYL